MNFHSNQMRAADHRKIISKQIQSLGYEFRPNFSTSDRFYFIIYLPDPEEETRRYHIHLTYPKIMNGKSSSDLEIISKLIRKLPKNMPK